jgi:branched-chain amino acid transport system ATP-binding protein
LLELIDVHTYYGESQVLRGVSLKIEKNSTVALLGRNGMGKTTTVRSIVGLTPARGGTILFNGKDITRLASYKIGRMGLSLVPQGRQIFPSLTVRENLLIGMRGNTYTLDMIHSFFPILRERAYHKGNQLSGGEQQMLAIARALLTNPDVLLMDEPSEGLAPLIVKQIGDTIVELKKKGLSILLVEQNVPLALRASDDVYVMHKGEIAYHCSAIELSKNEKIQAEYIGVSKRKTPNH